MERIIRSNAFETSSQSESSGINFHDLHSYYELAPEMALIHGGSVASSGAALPKPLTKIHTAMVTTPQSTISNTGNNWSTSLQALLNQPPSALPYLILLSSVAFVMAVSVWVWTGKIEQVSYIRGRFLALGELYKIQPQDSGKVVNIAVKEGQQVKAGQVIVELDRELKALEVEIQKQHLTADQMRFNQIKALMDRTRLMAQTRAANAAVKASQALPIRQSAITKNQLQQMPTAVEARLDTEAKTARNVTQSREQTQQTITQINELKTGLARTGAESRSIQQLAEEITQLRTKIAETKTLLNSAKAKLKKQFLHAPVDGIVSGLNIRHTSEVVQAGQTIAEIAPEDAPLIWVATLPEKEAGFIKKEDTMQITLDGYPERDYGTISGRVISIFPDAKPDEDNGQMYRVEVATKRNYVTDQTKKFKAGQTATAKIIYHRRIADMFLKPMKHLQQGDRNL